MGNIAFRENVDLCYLKTATTIGQICNGADWHLCMMLAVQIFCTSFISRLNPSVTPEARHGNSWKDCSDILCPSSQPFFTRFTATSLPLGHWAGAATYDMLETHLCLLSNETSIGVLFTCFSKIHTRWFTIWAESLLILGFVFSVSGTTCAVSIYKESLLPSPLTSPPHHEFIFEL